MEAGGHTWRRRRIEEQPLHGGSACPALMEVKECRTVLCVGEQHTLSKIKPSPSVNCRYLFQLTWAAGGRQERSMERWWAGLLRRDFITIGNTTSNRTSRGMLVITCIITMVAGLSQRVSEEATTWGTFKIQKLPLCRAGNTTAGEEYFGAIGITTTCAYSFISDFLQSVAKLSDAEGMLIRQDHKNKYKSNESMLHLNN